MGDALLVLGIIALSIPIPLLIIFHYTTRWKKSRELSGTDEAMLEDLWALSQKLEERVETLETILDDTEPDWRKKL